ncbi:MAG: fused MFS/spermidine synthase [Candidatus Latescibacterota bacterium]
MLFSHMILISACFFFSGVAALIYQTAWIRQFATVFGTSETAVAAVLSAYMGSLALGCWLAERNLIALPRPLRIYALLEAGIAFGALLLPLLQSGLTALYVGLFGNQPALPEANGLLIAYQWLATFAALVLPVGCMGATWPIIVRYVVRTDASIGPRTGLLYALNTAGAVLGTLATAYLLLSTLGLQQTIWTAAGVNGLVCLIALVVDRRVDNVGAVAPTSKAQPGHPAATNHKPLIALLIALSGLTAFFYEVFWTRLLSPTMAGTITAFATMLATFLAGLTLGGGIAGRLSSRAQWAAPGFAVAQLGTALLTLLAYEILCAVAIDQLGPAAQAGAAMMAIFPSALCIGATFPLAIRAYAHTAAEAAQATARLFTWNTLGAIAGSLIAGFYLLPRAGFAVALQLALALNIVLMLITVWRLCRMPAIHKWSAFGLACFALALYKPSEPTSILNASAVSGSTEGQTLFSSVGKAANVLLYESKGSFYLRTNGLPEASVRIANSPPSYRSARWLMALPIIARPAARSALVVGWGGGVLLEDIPSTVETVDVVELEPEVIAANRLIADDRHSNPLADPRIRIILNDARSALVLTDERYDIVVSQPSHPWTAGASHLYTSEFIGLAKQHLRPEGVFVQWIGTPFVDLALMRSLCATVLEHFSYLRVYQPTRGTFILLASDAALQLERRVQDRAAQPTAWQDYLRINGIPAPEDLLLTLALDESASAEFIHQAQALSDDDNPLAMRPLVKDREGAFRDLFEALDRYDPVVSAGSWVYTQLDTVRLDYMARRLIQEGYEQRALQLAQFVSNPTHKFLIQGYGLQQQGKLQAAKAAFARALTHESNNHNARYALIISHQTADSTHTANDSNEFGDQLLPTSARAVLQGQGFARRGDWVRLAKLEQQLATTQSIDGWHTDAILLRALWRRHIGELVEDQDVLYEAIGLIDSLLGWSHKAQLLFLRQEILAQLGETRAYIATAWQTHGHVRSLLKLGRDNTFALPTGESNMLQRKLNTTLAMVRSPKFEQNNTIELRRALHSMVDSLRLP